MKITPLEIRQKTFEKNFRGYDKEEVTAFLISLSHEWERMQDEKKALTEKLQQADKEVSKLREVESTLYKTLKTAEDTGANLVEQAHRQAELSLQESKMTSKNILTEARDKARHMQEEAEEFAKNIVNEMQEELRSMEQSFKMIEQQRDNLLTELRNLANATHDKVTKFSEKRDHPEFKDVVKEAKRSFMKKMDTLRDEFADAQRQIIGEHEEHEMNERSRSASADRHEPSPIKLPERREAPSYQEPASAPKTEERERPAPQRQQSESTGKQPSPRPSAPAPRPTPPTPRPTEQSAPRQETKKQDEEPAKQNDGGSFFDNI